MARGKALWIGTAILLALSPFGSAGVAGPSLAEGSQQSFRCPHNPLRGVYSPSRLHVLGKCRWFRGTVSGVSHESDGDYHVHVYPKPGYERFLNKANNRLLGGAMVTEIMPNQTLLVPEVGEHVEVFGTWVNDNGSWNEIHPIWGIRYLDRGISNYSIPSRGVRAPSKPDTGDEPEL